MMFLSVKLKNLLFPVIVCILVFGAFLIAFYYSKGYERNALPERNSEESASKVSNAEKLPQILIIDAGHGGEDGGCVSFSGQIEATVNLDIAKRMEALSGLLGIDTVMTRSSDTIAYPGSANTTRKRKAFDQRARINLINSTPNALLISIHQNKYPTEKPRGAQVLYAKTEGSDILAAQIQENLTKHLYTGNRRVAMPIEETILLMKSVKCPAVLVECGFLSNPAEDALLKTDSYRTKVAAIIIGSYINYLIGINTNENSENGVLLQGVR